MGHKHSKFQKKIFEKYKETTKNLFIKAGPGTGKSYVIKHLVGITPRYKKVIVTAFNKAIQEELDREISLPNVKVSTMHSIGYSVLRQNKAANFKLTGSKIWILCKKNLNLKDFKDEKEQNSHIMTICKLVDLYRLNLAKNEQQLEDVADLFSVEYFSQQMLDAMRIIDKMEEYNAGFHESFMIDFIDMLYLPITQINPRAFPKYDVTFIDESQDLNILQKTLIDRLMKPRGRFVAVGDDKQAIYSFMGSSLESFNEFATRPNTKVLPLSISYRCCKSVVVEANKVFSGLKAHKKAIEGEVRKGDIHEAIDGDFVVCRNNLPLIMAFLEFIKQGKRCYILGKDYGVGLSLMITKLSKYPTSKEGEKAIIKEVSDKLKDKGIDNPRSHPTFQKTIERLQIIKILKGSFVTYTKVREVVEELFSDDNKSGIQMSTIHKSKGLEANRIFFLNPELIPSEYAESELDLYQERCLKFVAITRAKSELIYCRVKVKDSVNKNLKKKK